MARRLFFVDEVRRGLAHLRGDNAVHLTRVLRVEPGQRYEISDNESRYLAEIETARKNRASGVGLFIYSSKTAPAGIEPLCRSGDDIFVVWNLDDPATDLYLKAGLSLARALCVRASRAREGQTADFADIDRAILEIEKRATSLDDIVTWATTIQNNSEKIIKKVDVSRKALSRQVEVLREKINDLRHLLPGATTDG